jgi:hypothetical protein
MTQKTLLLLVAVVLLAINGFAQSDSSMVRSSQECSTKIIEKLRSEAARLGLKAQGNLVFQSDGDVLMVVVPVVLGSDDGIQSKRLKRGSRAKFVYVESVNPRELPTGFYFIQSTPQLAKRMADRDRSNSGVLEQQAVNFISTDGRTIRDLPGVAASYQLPRPGFRHYWTRLIINGGSFWVDGEPE